MMVSLVFEVAGVEPPSRLRRRAARTSLGIASFPMTSTCTRAGRNARHIPDTIARSQDHEFVRALVRAVSANI